MTARIGLTPRGPDGLEVTLTCDHGQWSRMVGPGWNSAKSQRFAMRSLLKARLAESPCPCLERLALEV